MRQYFSNRQVGTVKSDKNTLRELDINESTKHNSESTRITSYEKTMKRIRPQTVNKHRTKTQTKLYTIEENSGKKLRKDCYNQKSTAFVKFDEIGSSTSVDIPVSPKKTKSKGKIRLDVQNSHPEEKERSSLNHRQAEQGAILGTKLMWSMKSSPINSSILIR